MAVKTIAIIGASGRMGSSIARSLSEAQYRVLLISSDPTKLAYLETIANNSSAEVEVIHCAVDGCWEADIILLAVPYAAEKEVATKIKEVATGKIVITISNQTDRQENTEIRSANELQMLLPYSKLIKAYHSITVENFNSRDVSGERLDSFIAGNDAEALETVSALVYASGFNPVWTGGIAGGSKLKKSGAQLLIGK